MSSRRLAWAAACVVAVSMIGAATAVADPEYTAENAAGGIYGRTQPNWNTPNQTTGFGVYNGTVFAVHCWQSGTAVPGSADTMWEYVTDVAGPGYGTFWLNEHFIADGQPIDQPSPGVPPCTSSSPPPASNTAAERAAVAWATPFANDHSNSYAGLCLEFVDLAYGHAGINLRSEISVPVNGGTYPLDIWGHFTSGRTGSGTPPYGALTFFEPRSGSASYRREYSHVALSIGGGTLISTEDGVATPIHYETMAQHSYALELGWWLPA